MSAISSPTRITGMNSGIDTDALVRAMTMSQQSKVDALSMKMKQAEWKKDLLTDFNNKLRVFRDTYGSMLGESSLMIKGAFAAYTVKMPENSGIQVTSSPSAKPGSYSVRVDQIATAAAMNGTKLTSRTSGLSEAEVNAGIHQLSLSGGSYYADSIRFSINGKDFSFASNTSLKRIMDEVNKSDAGVTMAYSQMSDSITVTSNKTGAYEPPAGASAAELAAYDRANAGKQISFSDDTGFLSFLGIGDVTAGQDAIVYFNGSAEARRLDSNTVTMDGITMTFTRPTGPQAVSFTLEADFKPAVDRIKQFVDSFNELIKELYTAHTQKVNRDFKPLTEEQRAQMSEKEIEVWEEKAREGLLYRDNTLGRLLDNMRGILGKTFGGNGTLASIGINTSRYTPGEPVQLELDESKLTAALQADPDRVHSLFSDNSGGLVPQLNKMMDDYVNTIKGRELQNLNNNIRDYSRTIKEQENKLMMMSEKYYIQYAKLETVLGQMQAQQDSLASFWGWNNNN